MKGKIDYATEIAPKIDVSGACMLWTGNYDNKAGGRRHYIRRTPWMPRREPGFKPVPVYRWLWDYMRPDDLVTGWFLTNRCGDERCVNPEHYFKSHQATSRAAGSTGASS